MKKHTTAIAFLLTLILLVCASCAPSSSTAPTVSPPGATENAIVTATAQATPYTEDDIDELCEKYGLNKDDLRGKYDLFRAFSEAVERDGDERFGVYKRLVYRIFPAVADHEKYLDRESFLNALSRLTIRTGDAGGNAGIYYDDSLNIILNDDADHVVTHELMHFVDFRIAPGEGGVWRSGNEVVSAAEYLRRYEKDSSISYTYETDCSCDFILEAGAEIMNAKYCSGGVGAYFDMVTYLTVLEYLFGTEAIREAFFSPESDVLVARLFLSAGVSIEEYAQICRTLNARTYPRYHPDFTGGVSLTDSLITLYKAVKKDDWEQDAVFCYLLASYNGIALEEYRSGRYAAVLERHLFMDFPGYERFQQTILDQTDASLSFNILPPPLLFINGKTALACGAKMTAADGKETSGVVQIFIDLDTRAVSSWTFLPQRF